MVFDKVKTIQYLKERLRGMYKIGFTDKDGEVKELKKQIYNLKEWGNINYNYIRDLFP